MTSETAVNRLYRPEMHILHHLSFTDTSQLLRNTFADAASATDLYPKQQHDFIKNPLYRPEMLVFGDILRIWHYTALPKDLSNTRLMQSLRSVMGSLMLFCEQPRSPSEQLANQRAKMSNDASLSFAKPFFWTIFPYLGTILGQMPKDSPKIGKDSPKKGLCERKGRIIAHFCSLVRKLFGRASEAVRKIASGSPSRSAGSASGACCSNPSEVPCSARSVKYRQKQAFLGDTGGF